VEEVVALISRVKNNKEFLQKNPNLFNKSPKEVIIAVKRMELFDKENKIRAYYNLKPTEILKDEQINEYLYLEAIGQLEKGEEKSNTSTAPSLLVVKG